MDESRSEDQGGTRGFHIVTSTGSIKNYLPGDKVDNTYLLQKFLGRGGMGVVFSCRHLGLNREYALKIISGKNLNAETWTRFEQEARALARLNHPGIVGIHNMGVDAGVCPYFVMDLLKGRGLDQVLKRDGPLNPEIALPLFLELTAALSAAHRKGVVHRDIKPSNLMAIESDGGRVSQLKLTDFGLARLVDSTGRSQAMTATGLVFGTPFYMSPEQIEGRKLDQRADIYSLGCTIFEALTGRPPYVGDNAFQTFEMHQTAPVPELREYFGDSQPVDALQVFMEKILAKAQNERYQNMEEVAHDLERILAGQSVQNYRAGRTGANSVSSSTAHPKNRNISRQASTEDGVDARASEATRDPFEDELGSPFVASNNGLRNAIIGVIAVIMILGGIGLVTVLRSEKVKPHERVLTRPVDRNLDSGVAEVVENMASRPDDEEFPGKLSDGLSNSPLKAASSFLGRGVLSKSNLSLVGALPEEMKRVEAINWIEVTNDYDKVYRPKFEAHAFSKDSGLSPLMSVSKQGANYRLEFPEDIYVCAMAVDSSKPRLVHSNVSLKMNSDVSLYFGYQTRFYPSVLREVKKLSNAGVRISALELTFKKLDNVFENLKGLPDLREISFFNSITKCISNLPEYEECRIQPQDLVLIDGLNSVVSLGLPGANLRAANLANLRLLSKISTFKLKGSNDIDEVLQLLSRYPNIKELWIIDCGLKDRDLKALAELKNLERLHIRRSLLTPASVDAFCRMSNLKTLYLDTKWINKGRSKEFQKLKSKIPDCHYEPMVDFTYWEMFPGRTLFPTPAK